MLAPNQSEFNWIAIEGSGEREDGQRRRLAVLVWIARTGPRARLTAGPALLAPADLPAIVRGLVPFPILSPFGVESDDRPLFMVVVYDLDRPDRRPRRVEIEIEHEDFDAATFSAVTAGGDLQLHQLTTRAASELRGTTAPDREPSGGDAFAIALRARAEGFDVELHLRPLKRMVTFGRAGSPRLRQGPIETSYAQRPRLAVAGRVGLDGETIADFRGEACQDRQWLTVTPAQVKWIWVQLRLDDGRELMGYVMRDGSGGRWRSANEGRCLAREGWLIEADGSVQPLPRLTVSAIEGFEVRSDERGVCPTRFAVEVPELDGLTVILEHVIEAPFVPMKAFGPMLDAGIWEGPACVVESNRNITARAWVEVMSTAAVRLARPTSTRAGR